MTQTERRKYLIKYLLKERGLNSQIKIPPNVNEQKRLLRSLLNVRMPADANAEFLKIQNAYLQKEINHIGITNFKDLQPIKPGLYIWHGNITTLACDAIVNAANSKMLGCFCPNHKCIDNAIHTFAGVQLRLACAKLMRQKKHDEETGYAKITSAYNLPCKYIIHTVGPIVSGKLTNKHCKQLADCYKSCLELADKTGIKNIAFCCISTGEFNFPNKKAAQIATETVINYKAQTNSKIEVTFNVFKETDYKIYRKLLEAN